MAATTTFKTLQDRCLTYGYGEVDRANFKVWINQAYRDVVGSWKWSWLTASGTITTASGTQSYSSPTDLMVFGKLVPKDVGLLYPEFTDRMDFRQYMDVNEVQTANGMPTHFTLDDTSIAFYPIPNAVYRYTILYWKEPPALSADGDISLMADSDVDVLVLGALARSTQRENDMTRFQVYTAQFNDQVAQMVRTEKAMQKQTVRRATMPDTYAGAYDTDA